MDLPRQYPYNPRPRLIFFVSGAGLLWIGVQRLSWGHMPTGFSLWFGLTPIVMALLLGLRRVWFDRWVLLDKEEMVQVFCKRVLHGLRTLVSSVSGGIISRRRSFFVWQLMSALSRLLRCCFQTVRVIVPSKSSLP